jgi:hypothetical protein
MFRNFSHGPRKLKLWSLQSQLGGYIYRCLELIQGVYFYASKIPEFKIGCAMQVYFGF